jgi:hypothetical protein
LLLATDVYAGALIRRAQLAGAFAAVTRKGDPRAGALMVKTLNQGVGVREPGAARLYIEATGPEGDRLWIEPLPGAEEAELDAYVARQAGYDPDLWVVEIEDREGRHFLTEPVAPARSTVAKS